MVRANEALSWQGVSKHLLTPNFNVQITLSMLALHAMVSSKLLLHTEHPGFHGNNNRQEGKKFLTYAYT
jgi:hypothetical protein